MEGTNEKKIIFFARTFTCARLNEISSKPHKYPAQSTFCGENGFSTESHFFRYFLPHIDIFMDRNTKACNIILCVSANYDRMPQEATKRNFRPTHICRPVEKEMHISITNRLKINKSEIDTCMRTWEYQRFQ